MSKGAERPEALAPQPPEPSTGAEASGDRDAIRSSQRLASQLHQLIAASITVAGLRTEHEILENLAASTRRVFDADTAILSLESGDAAPLRGVAHRGQRATSVDAEADGLGAPTTRPRAFGPWRDGEWLAAPILERRGQARGVLAIRRAESDFGDEEKEVLTLLAQMAASALGATELSRGIETSETRLRILVDTAPAGIVEVDLDGEVRWWNRAASQIFSWPKNDVDADQHVYFPDTTSDDLAALRAEVTSSDAPAMRDLINIEIRGRQRDLTVSAALLPSPDAQPSSILLLVDDVTDHRQLKAEVHHAQQMEIRGRVASSVAHDFNNLLTLISGYAEILAKDLADDARSLEMVKDIQSTASRASMLTAQLQTIGRTELLQPIVVDPVATLQSNAEVLERIIGDDIELTWSLDDTAGTIRVDPAQFEQMILNFAINARDAMPDGGQLRISVEPTTLREPQSETLGVPEGDYVVVSVADSGTGMSEETRLHCFDPFFTTKGPFKGTGLGLAAARRLVEGSGGSISCRSELGQGTTFVVMFPTAHESVEEEAPASLESRPRGSATVLVAEDDDGLRQLMARVLERNGYRVLLAHNGEEALDLAKAFEETIDLLVTDVVMAELSGPDLATSLQGSRDTLRVLITSGTADASVLNVLRPGSGAFLAKPFRPSALIDQVHELLSRK